MSCAAAEIAKLDSEDFAEREDATKALTARGEAVLLLETAEKLRTQPEALARRLGELAKTEKLGVPERADLETLQTAWKKALAADQNARVQSEKTP